MALDIRQACSEDRDNLLVLIALMHAESPRFNQFAFSLDKAVTLTEAMITHCGVFVAIKDDEMIGFFAGGISEHFLSVERYACDVGVFVRSEHRGGSAFMRLVKAFEAWAINQGVFEICLGVSTQVNADSTVRMYERLGYKISSTSLIKRAGI